MPRALLLCLPRGLLLCLLAAAAGQAQEPTGLPALDAALARCERLDAPSCRVELAAAADAHPAAALPQFYLGLVAQQGLNDGDAATRAYETAYALDPNHIDTLCNLGKTRSDRAAAIPATAASDEADAVHLWTRALELDPTHRMSRLNLALHIHSRGDFDEAMAHWDVMLDAFPQDPEVLYNAAVTIAYRGLVQPAADMCGRRRPRRLASAEYPRGTPRRRRDPASAEYLRGTPRRRRDPPPTGTMLASSSGRTTSKRGSISRRSFINTAPYARPSSTTAARSTRSRASGRRLAATTAPTQP